MVSLSTRNANQRGLLATLSNASTVAAAGIGASILVPILLQSYITFAICGGIAWLLFLVSSFMSVVED